MVEVILLGTAQDGGVPQVGCNVDCCQDVERRYPVSLGLTDSQGNHHLFEASRYLGEQMRLWNISSIDSDSTFSEETLHRKMIFLHFYTNMNIVRFS